MLNGEGLKLAQRYFKPAWIGHLSQRGSRSAHLGLLEQNVIDRVGSAAWCGEEPRLWKTLPSVLSPSNPE